MSRLSGGRRKVRQRADASGFARIYQAAGNQVVYQGAESYQLTAWPLQAQPLVAREARARPSVLLRAANGLTDFVDRPGALADFREWRDGPAHGRVAIRLVHGPGGQGKTRLAGHLADLWQHQGWVALAAHQRRDRSAPEIFQIPALDEATGLLVVVDYAERWDTVDLLSLLADTRIRAALPVRVLLLARSAGTWWQGLKYRIDRELNLTATRYELKPLEQETGIDRGTLFAAARDRFAELLEIPGAKRVDPPAALERHESYQLVLTVHMAALAAVLACGEGQTGPVDPVAVSKLLLDRERDRWRTMFVLSAEDRLLTSPDAMGQLVYTATVTGRLRYDDGLAALTRAKIESSEHPGQLLKDHARCYPPLGSGKPGHIRQDAAPAHDVGQAMVLEPLYPDRLGEDFLALATPGHSYDYPVDPWADDAPARLLAPPRSPGDHADDRFGEHDSMPGWVRHGMITLIEAADRWPHLAHRLYRLVATYPHLALHAGGAALATLANMEGINPELLEKIESVLPTRQHVDLDIGIAAVATRLSKHRLATTTDPAERAVIYDALAVRLSYAGLRASALTANEHSTEVWHRLVEANRDAYLPNLAASMGNYANRLAEAGRREKAALVSEQTLTLYQELVQANPDIHLPNLAMSLNNHANRLKDIGRREEALLVSQEAVDLYEKLLELNREMHLPDLARALANHAIQLTYAGQREEAVSVSERALILYRELVQINANARLPNLAMSLKNHAGLLAEVGRREEALPVSQEAVDLYEKLVELNREAYLPGLATALDTHAVRLGQVGRRGEAVSVSERALVLYRELVPAGPDLSLPQLALLLNNHAGLLAQIGRCEEALPVSQEAVDLYEKLVELNREAHRPGLAGALNNHAVLLSQIGRREAAVQTSQEAVHLRRELVQANPDAYLPDLAMSLNNHARLLTEIGHCEEAVSVSQETVGLHSDLVKLNREAYLPNLAMSLVNNAGVLAEIGRREAAVSASEQALTFYRELARTNPDVYVPDLVKSLTNYANRLAQVRRCEEGLLASREAFDLSLALAQANPHAYLADLAGSLTTYAAQLAQVGQCAEAVPASQEAVRLMGKLVERNREAHLPDYTRSLTVLGLALVQCARFGEAVAPLAAAFATAQQLPEYAQRIIGMIVDLLRRCHAGDAAVVAAKFCEITGQDVPDWMRQSPAAED
ncbi:tetratricopeptide repeat protein [Nonomuraea sp. AD125B]|uniref:tetratricopeptide repeat protein n=1 Tax=Nonomuraea sp. AD125B TaxID=3242897 RepID=UPI00352753D2